MPSSNTTEEPGQRRLTGGVFTHARPSSQKVVDETSRLAATPTGSVMPYLQLIREVGVSSSLTAQNLFCGHGLRRFRVRIVRGGGGDDDAGPLLAAGSV